MTRLVRTEQGRAGQWRAEQDRKRMEYNERPVG